MKGWPAACRVVPPNVQLVPNSSPAAPCFPLPSVPPPPQPANINLAMLAPVFTMSCIFVVLKKSEGGNYWCVLSIKLLRSKMNKKCSEGVDFFHSCARARARTLTHIHTEGKLSVSRL